jgi:hypothetical protein
MEVAIKYLFFISLFTFYYNLPYGPTALLLRDFLLTNSQHDHEKKCCESYLRINNKPSDKAVSFVDTSTAEIAINTISNDDKMIVPKQHTDLIQIMEKQIKDITSAMSQKYKSTIKQMEQTHIVQMDEIVTKQREHESEIKNLQVWRRK